MVRSQCGMDYKIPMPEDHTHFMSWGDNAHVHLKKNYDISCRFIRYFTRLSINHRGSLHIMNHRYTIKIMAGDQN